MLTSPTSHSMATDLLMIALFSMPEFTSTPRPPIWFTGGFAYSTKHVGDIIARQSAIQLGFGLAVVVMSRHIPLSRYCLRILQIAPVCFAILYMADPFLSLVSRNWRMSLIYVNTAVKYTAQNLSVSAINVMLKKTASKEGEGNSMGRAQSRGCLGRCLGLILSGLLQAFGLWVGTLLVPWWICAGVAVVASIPVWRLDRRNGATNGDEKTGALSPLKL